MQPGTGKPTQLLFVLHLTRFPLTAERFSVKRATARDRLPALKASASKTFPSFESNMYVWKEHIYVCMYREIYNACLFLHFFAVRGAYMPFVPHSHAKPTLLATPCAVCIPAATGDCCERLFLCGQEPLGLIERLKSGEKERRQKSFKTSH